MDVLKQNYEECDVLITVSPEHTLMNPEPGKIFVGFRDVMNVYLDIEKRTQRKRPLVWILDNGFRKFDDEESRRKYMNVKQLKIRFEALRDFDDPLRSERWNWLNSTASFIVLDDRNERTNLPGSKMPIFSAYDISFNDHAREWIADNGFRTLYGKELEEIKQRTFSVLFNNVGNWPSSEEAEDPLRYFGFASFKAGEDKFEGRGLELPSLSPRYEEGFRAVCAAARSALSLETYASGPISESDSNNGKEAEGQLASLGYRVLRLETFLQQY
jgi:hypothetical protein